MAISELDKLLAQQADIAKKIEEVKQKEREPIIANIKAMIAEYDFTAKELGFKSTKKKAKSLEVTTVEALYQNEHGVTWSGRGRAPSWLKDTDGQVSDKLKKKYAINK